VMSLSLSIIGFVGGCSIQVKTFHDREYGGRQKKSGFRAGGRAG